MSVLLKIDSDDMAILASKYFEPSPNNNVLTFKFFRPALGITLDVCFDSDIQDSIDCHQIYPLTGKNGLKWNSFSVLIPSNAIRVNLKHTIVIFLG